MSAKQRTRELDKHVGRRIRERRLMPGLTQANLAAMLGISYQQAHKYEIGSSKVAAGRLFEIAQYLDVPVSYFYDNLSALSSAQTLRNRLCLEVVRNFLLIKNPAHRNALTDVAKALAGISGAEKDASSAAAPGDATQADEDTSGAVSPGEAIRSDDNSGGSVSLAPYADRPAPSAREAEVPLRAQELIDR